MDVPVENGVACSGGHPPSIHSSSQRKWHFLPEPTAPSQSQGASKGLKDNPTSLAVISSEMARRRVRD